MSVGVRKWSISSLKLTSDVELSPSTVIAINLQWALSFSITNGWGKHCWNSCSIKLLKFLWSYLTRWYALKMVARNVMGVFPRCAFATCKFGPFVVQHQMIDVIASFTTSLTTQLSNRSSNLYAYNCASMGSSFTLFSIVSSMGSLLAMTKVGLWLTFVMCFK